MLHQWSQDYIDLHIPEENILVKIQNINIQLPIKNSLVKDYISFFIKLSRNTHFCVSDSMTVE
jgi:hypothetical protein